MALDQFDIPAKASPTAPDGDAATYVER